MYLPTEMKERQRWRPEEETLLRTYVKQYGPRDWHLLSERMNKPLNRNTKSCLERWKNYLKPGIKRESLTEEEQRLVIHLQAKHGNKWKKIAAKVPGRTAKRLGKWWEVFKEKKQRVENKVVEPIEEGKYDRILENFAEKLVQERAMATSNGRFLQTDAASAPSGGQSVIPPWLASSSKVRPIASPSVTLSLSPSPANAVPWLQPGNNFNNPISIVENPLISEIFECVKELEEGHRTLSAHKKEAAWRLKRVELQLESEKASRRRDVMEDTEAKVAALRVEQRACLDRIESEYREQLAGLRREAEVKEQKLAEQWAVKHERLSKFVKRMGYGSGAADRNGR